MQVQAQEKLAPWWRWGQQRLESHPWILSVCFPQINLVERSCVIPDYITIMKTDVILYFVSFKCVGKQTKCQLWLWNVLYSRITSPIHKNGGTPKTREGLKVRYSSLLVLVSLFLVPVFHLMFLFMWNHVQGVAAPPPRPVERPHLLLGVFCESQWCQLQTIDRHVYLEWLHQTETEVLSPGSQLLPSVCAHGTGGAFRGLQPAPTSISGWPQWAKVKLHANKWPNQNRISFSGWWLPHKDLSSELAESSTQTALVQPLQKEVGWSHLARTTCTGQCGRSTSQRPVQWKQHSSFRLMVRSQFAASAGGLATIRDSVRYSKISNTWFLPSKSLESTRHKH